MKVEWRKGDLADLAFLRAESIDAAFSADAVAEVDDAARLFRQVQRVLKPNAAVRVLVRAPDGAVPRRRRRRCERSYFDPGPIDVDDGGRRHPQVYTRDIERGVHRARPRGLPGRHRSSSRGPHDARRAEAAAHHRVARPARKAPDRSRLAPRAGLALDALLARPRRRGARRRRPRSIGPSSRRASSRKSSASPTTRPGCTPRYVHHLAAVERRADGVELLLLAQLGDPRARGRPCAAAAPARGSGCGWCSRSAGGG